MEMDKSVVISIVTLIPMKKLNSLPRSAILRDFQNQEYRFTIPKFLTRLAEKQEKEGEKEYKQLQNVMPLTVEDLPVANGWGFTRTYIKKAPISFLVFLQTVYMKCFLIISAIFISYLLVYGNIKNVIYRKNSKIQAFSYFTFIY